MYIFIASYSLRSTYTICYGYDLRMISLKKNHVIFRPYGYIKAMLYYIIQRWPTQMVLRAI